MDLPEPPDPPDPPGATDSLALPISKLTTPSNSSLVLDVSSSPYLHLRSTTSATTTAAVFETSTYPSTALQVEEACPANSLSSTPLTPLPLSTDVVSTLGDPMNGDCAIQHDSINSFGFSDGGFLESGAMATGYWISDGAAISASSGALLTYPEASKNVAEYWG